LDKDFSKCNVLIYDKDNNQLANVKIWEHNNKENYIIVQDWPELAGVDRCKLLILTAPAPYAYSGVMSKHNIDKIIRLYEEHVEENRREVRYKTDLAGVIESLVYEGKSYPLHTSINVRIINISKSGMRIHARGNTLTADDILNVMVKIGENDKLLTGTVVNFKDYSPEHSEYGCYLVGKDGESD
jgi:hypothetical protein